MAGRSTSSHLIRPRLRFAGLPTVDAALDAFSPRRRPRVDWVQAQSDALARDALVPAAVRDSIIKERGAQAFRDRYTPLLRPA
jgi:2-polyprenyl-6-methoxyphenol hydroxylase-like FAD-dependent oxidoreductase